MQQLISKFLVYSGGLSKSLSDLFDFTVGRNGISLFFLFFLLAIFLAALSFGKTRIVLALLATYIAAFLELIFIYRPELAKFFGNFLKLPAVFWARLFVFAVFFMMVFLILNRSILRPKMSLQESPPLAILFLSILQGIFWLSIVSSFLPAGSSIVLSHSFAEKYLTAPTAKLVWAFIPFLSLLFLRRKKAI